MPTSTAQAHWQGDIKNGKGSFRLGSGTEAPYSFATRFEDQPGANPEELIGAAHAACFSMALSKTLAQAGYEPRDIRTEAAVDVNKSDSGFSIDKIALTTEVAAGGDLDADTLNKLGEQAKDDCVVSRALQGVSIELDATLAG